MNVRLRNSTRRMIDESRAPVEARDCESRRPGFPGRRLLKGSSRGATSSRCRMFPISAAPKSSLHRLVATGWRPFIERGRDEDKRGPKGRG